MGAHGIGVVALIEPGVAIWSTERRRLVPGDAVPVGGMVLDVTERVDRETGEVERAFVCVDHTDTRPKLHWSILREDEVDRGTAETVDVAKVVSLWRRLAEEIAYPRSRYKLRRGPATAEEARLANALHRLTLLVFGPDGPLYGVMRADAPEKPYFDERPPAPVNVSGLVD